MGIMESSLWKEHFFTAKLGKEKARNCIDNQGTIQIRKPALVELLTGFEGSLVGIPTRWAAGWSEQRPATG